MWKLALRHLLSKKSQTILIFLGILFGAVAFITVSGFFLGLQEFIVHSLINNDGALKINSKEEIIEAETLKTFLFKGQEKKIFWLNEPTSRSVNNYILNPSGWYEIFKNEPQVIAYTPLLTATVNISLARSSASCLLIGTDVASQVKVTTIGDYMINGSFSDLQAGGNRIILGVGIAKKIGASMLQTVFVSQGTGHSFPFKVVGLFKTGNENFDNGRAYTSLSDAQKMTSMPNQINEIAVKLRDYNEANQLSFKLAPLSTDRVRSWDQLNASFLTIFDIQNAMRYFVVTVVLIVAAFGVYNVLNMAVNQKKKEIAILRSIGFEGNDILRLFFTQGFLVGLAGGGIGVILGYFICLGIQAFPISRGGPFGEGIQISFLPGIYISAFVLAILTATFASIIPARSAGKLSPIEIIRAGAE